MHALSKELTMAGKASVDGEIFVSVWIASDDDDDDDIVPMLPGDCIHKRGMSPTCLRALSCSGRAQNDGDGEGGKRRCTLRQVF